MNLDFSSFSWSYKEIQERFTHAELLQYYFPELSIGKKNHSPLRNDNDPSFLINYYNNSLHFKDLATGQKGNIYDLIGLKYGLTFTQVLNRITQDFINNAPATPTVKSNIEPLTKPQSTFKLSVKRRAWNENDLKYWQQFGITFDTLLKYNVAPIEYIFYFDKVLKCDPIAYVYKEEKDSIVTLKTYQPYSKNFKWLSDCTEQNSAWEGWTQLPKKGDLLIWTKSRKDLMSIYDTTGIPAISLQSESWIPKYKVVQELKDRFTKIVILYDNDYDKSQNFGRQLGSNLSTIFNIPQIEIPTEYESKDYSTLYHKHGVKSVEILKNLC